MLLRDHSIFYIRNLGCGNSKKLYLTVPLWFIKPSIAIPGPMKFVPKNR